jgi:hypothetical protein
VAGQAIYPSKGQSPEQQKQDDAVCNSWAVGQAGYFHTRLYTAGSKGSRCGVRLLKPIIDRTLLPDRFPAILSNFTLRSERVRYV